VVLFFCTRSSINRLSASSERSNSWEAANCFYNSGGAAMDLFGPLWVLVSLMVGFLAGYAVRAHISHLRHRRAQWR
jgi:hypothetical protein